MNNGSDSSMGRMVQARLLRFIAIPVAIILIALLFSPQIALAPPPAADHLSLFVLPEDGSDVILEALDDADESIVFVMYLVTSSDFVDALKAAEARGIEVRGMMELNPYGGSSSNIDVFNELVEAGADMKWDHRGIKYLHEKMILIDDEKMFVMTSNMTTSAFTANREYGLIDTDPAHIAEVVQVFEADWNREDPALEDPLLVWSPFNARSEWLGLIEGARNSIDLEQSSMLDPEIEGHLIDAARRGVTVRYISTPDWPLEDDLDEPARERLRLAGVFVRYLDDPFVHAKVFLVDGVRGFVGSENVSTNSLDNNRELGIIFEDKDSVERLATQFEVDWAAAGKEAFPTAGGTALESDYIHHSDARKFFYSEAVVELPVLYVYNSGRVAWLMPDEDADSNFKAVIFPSDFSKWPEPPDVYYGGKVIRVAGLIEKYRGWPEIIVHDPEAIEIVGDTGQKPGRMPAR
jgi:phosphatidylserine/phosphatidylglycerophosphate/cardiolipin synthase-like enzyme